MTSRLHFNRGNEHGFVLAAVLVFLVVLALSAFMGAALSRTGTQVVTNVTNEKKAFYRAEAGVTEALVRLGMKSGTNVTVGGATFDAAIVPDTTNPSWKGYILFSGAGPATSGNPPVLTTPTLQADDSSRLLYSTAAQGTGALRLQWQTVTVAGVESIKQIGGKNVLDVVSTGVSGPAQRTVTVSVIQNLPIPSVLTSATGCNQGISMNGTTNLSVSGAIQVNGSCSGAISGVGAAVISAGGPINVVGGVDMKNPPTPTPTTGVSPIDDPLAGLLPPCFGSNLPPNCQVLTSVPLQQGSPGPLTPTTQNINGGALNPGIYYGGLSIQGKVTMKPGVYIMAGGGFSVTKNTTDLNATAGVVIYNTQNDNPLFRGGAGGYGEFNISENPNVDLTSPSTGPFQGIALFQDRLNTQPVHLQGGSGSGSLDGVIYAINSAMDLQGSYTLKANFIVYTLELQGSSIMEPPTNVALATGSAFDQIAWQDF